MMYMLARIHQLKNFRIGWLCSNPIKSIDDFRKKIFHWVDFCSFPLQFHWQVEEHKWCSLSFKITFSLMEITCLFPLLFISSFTEISYIDSWNKLSQLSKDISLFWPAQGTAVISIGTLWLFYCFMNSDYSVTFGMDLELIYCE